jgi:hypothetical protein
MYLHLQHWFAANIKVILWDKKATKAPQLKGQNGELYVLVVSGSERVYVNGTLLKRGENNDYTIDYNAGEIIFTPLFTITSEMRIAIEYNFLIAITPFCHLCRSNTTLRNGVWSYLFRK